MAAIATPVIVLLMLILLNKKGVMGEYRPGFGMNLLLSVIFLFTVFMAITGVIGIKGLF